MPFSLSRLLFHVLLVLLPISITSTTWLYLYPIFHCCAFPRPTPQAPTQISYNSSDTSGNSPGGSRGNGSKISRVILPTVAPFRLLALGDPQLEGDSSLPSASDPFFPSIANTYSEFLERESLTDKFDALRNAVTELFASDIPTFFRTQRKKLDLFGNDYYLAHIFRSLYWWTEPTHVTVLGDLLGSQWISDKEFQRRGERFWERVFTGMERVPDHIMDGKSHPQGSAESKREDDSEEGDTESKEEGEEEKEPCIEVLGANPSWSKRIINIAGNHDIGYAGDINAHRVLRFEKVFGRVNWEITFTLPTHPSSCMELGEEDSALDIDTDSCTPNPGQPAPPALRLIILNSMNLDTMALTPHLQTQTYEFLNDVISRSRPVEDKTVSTIVLTHIPLHKEEGVCVDAPFFDFYDDGRVKEQNHLSPHASKGILEGIFGMSGDENAPGKGMGRPGIVLTGHDHEGCDVEHYIHRPTPSSNSDDTTLQVPAEKSEPEPEDIPPRPEQKPEPHWQAHRLGIRGSSPSSPSNLPPSPASEKDIPHLREITLRSMMGEFAGRAGFLSAWFDASVGENGEWVLEFRSCSLGVQHWWWGVHVLDLVTVITAILNLGVWGVEKVGGANGGRRGGDRKGVGKQGNGAVRVEAKDGRGRGRGRGRGGMRSEEDVVMSDSSYTSRNGDVRTRGRKRGNR